MSAIFLVPIDLSNLELRNALAQLLGSDPTGVEGKFYYNTTAKTFVFYNGTAWIALGRLDQISAPTASVSLNSQKITNLLDGTAAADAINKGQLDAAIAGLAWKDQVRAATAVAGTLATSFENGDTIDGVVLATGDRILIKDQAAGAENGIYVVAASGAPVRSTDADSLTDLASAAVMAAEGTANANTQWSLTTDNVTPGTTAQVWVQFGGASTYTAGDGLTLTGNDFDVNVANGIEIAADAVQIENGGVLTAVHGGTGAAALTDHGVLLGSGTAAVTPTAVGATGTVLKGVTGADPAFAAVDLAADVGATVLPIANGGTAGATAAAAAAALGFMRRFAATIGDAAATSFNIDHNFGSLDVVVQVYRNSDGVEMIPDITRSTTNRVIVAFAVAPATNAYRVVVVG